MVHHFMNEEAVIGIFEVYLGVFGGATVVLVALINWIFSLWQKRILQKEQAILLERIEGVKKELGFEKSSYDHYLGLVMDYYNMYYRHYRLCQRAAFADGHREDDGSITRTKDDFCNGLEAFLSEWVLQEGKMRLLLPSEILDIHEESIKAFNRMKEAVFEFNNSDEARERKIEAFRDVEQVKSRLEASLREFLRTERLLK